MHVITKKCEIIIIYTSKLMENVLKGIHLVFKEFMNEKEGFNMNS